MKKVLTAIVIAAFYLCGCSSREKYSTGMVDSAQTYIIGDLTFGISEDVAVPLIEKFDKENEDRERDNAKFFGKFQYSYISADYDKDSGLYKICINGIKNNKLSDDTTKLEKIFVAKYSGADTAASVFAIRPKGKNQFYFNNVKTWKIGKKRIVIQEVLNDTNRQVNLLIYRADIENKVIAGKEQAKHLYDSVQTAAIMNKNY